MKQIKPTFRVLSVLLAFCFFIGGLLPNSLLDVKAVEYSDNYESLSPEEKQAYLEQQLKEVNSKLDQLEQQSKNTEEYISTLDKKLGYLGQQLTVTGNQINESEDKISLLERQYRENEEEIASLEVEIDRLANESEEVKIKFDKSYANYRERAKAMYVSGNTSVLEALLSSTDISTFLTRIEMIRRVTKQDSDLLNNLMEQGEKLTDTKNQLSSKQDSLANNQQALVKNRESLSQTVNNLNAQQSEFADIQNSYESEKKEADELLLKLQNETQTYSEYRHQDQAELNAVNREIEEAAQKYLEELEKQTTTITTTTTTTTTTDGESGEGDSEHTTAPPKTTTTTTKKTASSKKLKMTFPVPSQTKITTGYGSAGYVGHTGVDFACASGSAVVAVESGIVIISKDLKDANGNYRSYGRYIVIAHDKKNSAGNYVYSLYAHNSSRVVSEGQRVYKGQLIAYSGSTGNSTGPHCHFEVRTPTASYDHCVDPTGYLPR